MDPGSNPIKSLLVHFFCGSRIRTTTIISVLLISFGLWSIWPQVPEGEERDPKVWAKNSPERLPTLSPEELQRRKDEIKRLNGEPDESGEADRVDLKRDTAGHRGHIYHGSNGSTAPFENVIDSERRLMKMENYSLPKDPWVKSEKTTPSAVVARPPDEEEVPDYDATTVDNWYAGMDPATRFDSDTLAYDRTTVPATTSTEATRRKSSSSASSSTPSHPYHPRNVRGRGMGRMEQTDSSTPAANNDSVDHKERRSEIATAGPYGSKVAKADETGNDGRRRGTPQDGSYGYDGAKQSNDSSGLQQSNGNKGSDGSQQYGRQNQDRATNTDGSESQKAFEKGGEESGKAEAESKAYDSANSQKTQSDGSAKGERREQSYKKAYADAGSYGSKYSHPKEEDEKTERRRVESAQPYSETGSADSKHSSGFQRESFSRDKERQAKEKASDGNTSQKESQ